MVPPACAAELCRGAVTRMCRSNMPPTPLVRYGRALLAMLVLIGNASAAAESPIRSIDVAYDGETYVVNAVMYAPVGQAVAWAVLGNVVGGVGLVTVLRLVQVGPDTIRSEQHHADRAHEIRQG